MRLALTGDVMLGRMVDEDVIRNRSLRPEVIWGDILPVMLKADCRLINLECVISSQGEAWHPATKAFHFRAHPRAVDVLRAAKIDGVTLANNHVLDYGPDALLDCVNLLDRAGIKRTGAGAMLEEALAPAVFALPEASVAVVSLTDNEPEWEATNRKPGVNYVAYNDRGLVEPYRSRMTQVLLSARRQAELVIVSAHVGPNWGAPSRAMQALAHELLDMGADLYWGHSNHTPQGIELYRGKVILYSSGDFIDDYMVDQDERNDLSFLFLVEVEGNRVRQVLLHPIRIEDCRVRRANEREYTFLARTMQAKCAAFETSILFREGVGTVTIE
ncbi:MAG: CapA family protein [Nitrospira sp.]|uniref:PGA_cap domain-containing protein n=1 Tax=Nitrospira defluvii TaxID=330214 RepID=A0ABN7LQC3_9BACT|nr:CapA family protein [Nitrospira defluvii]MCS6329695.1 CapA family protein [Nitrospira sp.]CAE6759003.1 PGA_cap domain-containing protein [Nitrospira defluvii]